MLHIEFYKNFDTTFTILRQHVIDGATNIHVRFNIYDNFRDVIEFLLGPKSLITELTVEFRPSEDCKLDLSFVSRCIEQNKCLKVLNLESANSLLNPCLVGLSKNSTIKSFSIIQMGLTKEFAEFIECNKTINTLRLDRFGYKVGVIELFFLALSKNKSVKCLHIDFPISQGCEKEFSYHISNCFFNNNSITELNLLNMFNIDVGEIIRSLYQNTSIQSLALRNCALDNMNMYCVIHFVKNNKNLKKLDLQKNYFRKRVVALLIDALLLHPNILAVNIDRIIKNGEKFDKMTDLLEKLRNNGRLAIQCKKDYFGGDVDVFDEHNKKIELMRTNVKNICVFLLWVIKKKKTPLSKDVMQYVLSLVRESRFDVQTWAKIKI